MVENNVLSTITIPDDEKDAVEWLALNYEKLYLKNNYPIVQQMLYHPIEIIQEEAVSFVPVTDERTIEKLAVSNNPYIRAALTNKQKLNKSIHNQLLLDKQKPVYSTYFNHNLTIHEELKNNIKLLNKQHSNHLKIREFYNFPRTITSFEQFEKNLITDLIFHSLKHKKIVHPELFNIICIEYFNTKIQKNKKTSTFDKIINDYADSLNIL